MKQRSPQTGKICALHLTSGKHLTLNPTEKILSLTSLHRRDGRTEGEGSAVEETGNKAAGSASNRQTVWGQCLFLRQLQTFEQ